MKAQHTPGNWQISQRKTRQDGKEVVTITAPHPDGGGQDIIECLAENAPIILSASDLLAACKLFREQLAKFGKEHPQYGGWAGLLCTADKAISKAESPA